MERRPWGLLLAIVLLVAASATVLVVEGHGQQRRRQRSREFQQLVGGLGFGPALDLSSCPFGFDPRLDGSCGEDRGPVPGGACFCRRHHGGIFAYPPLPDHEPVAP